MHLQFTFKRSADSQSLPIPARQSGAAAPAQPRAPRLPAIWSELHLRALTQEGTDDSAWLADFGSRIIGRCSCRQQWSEDLKAVPPAYGQYFDWTVAIHNRVNGRIGKAIMTSIAARTFWEARNTQLTAEHAN